MQRSSTPQWLVSSVAGLWLLGEMPAMAETDFSQGSFSAGSYYVSLGLFLVTLPGVSPLPSAEHAGNRSPLPGSAMYPNTCAWKLQNSDYSVTLQGFGPSSSGLRKPA